MSESIEILRALKIVNTYDLLKAYANDGKGPGVFAVARHHQKRSDSFGCTLVMHFNMHPDAAWPSFMRASFAGSLKESMPLALAWASKKYGVKEWAVDPTDRSVRVPAEVRAFADRLVAEHQKRGAD